MWRGVGGCGGVWSWVGVGEQMRGRARGREGREGWEAGQLKGACVAIKGRTALPSYIYICICSPRPPPGSKRMRGAR